MKIPNELIEDACIQVLTRMSVLKRRERVLKMQWKNELIESWLMNRRWGTKGQFICLSTFSEYHYNPASREVPLSINFRNGPWAITGKFLPPSNYNPCQDAYMLTSFRYIVATLGAREH